jgi:hypothetical protein
LTPYIETVAAGTSVTIPKSAITWSISAPAGATIVVNGDSITGASSLNGSGPLYQEIVVSSTVGTGHVAYTLNNVVYNVPGYY